MQAYSESVVAEPTRWLADEESKPAPGPLLRVQALVNTVELPSGPDRLSDPADARPWLIDNDLIAPDGRLEDADLQLLRDVREAVRALLMHNGGGPSPTYTSTWNRGESTAPSALPSWTVFRSRLDSITE